MLDKHILKLDALRVLVIDEVPIIISLSNVLTFLQTKLFAKITKFLLFTSTVGKYFKK